MSNSKEETDRPKKLRRKEKSDSSEILLEKSNPVADRYRYICHSYVIILSIMSHHLGLTTNVQSMLRDYLSLLLKKIYLIFSPR